MKTRYASLVPIAAMLLNSLAVTPAQACTLCSCSASTTDINFGTYNPLTITPKTANATVAVNCSGIVSLLGSVDIAVSSGSSGAILDRTMKKGSDVLHYNIYTNASYTSVLGNGSGGTNLITQALTGLLIFNTSATIYGKINAQQWVAPGNYSDSIIVTITY